MRPLVVFGCACLFFASGCSSMTTWNDKKDGTVPRSFVAEGRLPTKSSDEMAEYLVRRFQDSRARVKVIPFTAPLVAKMEDERGFAPGLSLPPKGRCVFVEVVTQDREAAELENLSMFLWLPGGKRLLLTTVPDSVERNERIDYSLSRRSVPREDDDRPRRAREAALRELESRELRCAEEAIPWEGGFVIEVRRLYDPSLPKQWLRWSVTRQARAVTAVPPSGPPAADAATIEPLGVVKRSPLR